MKIETAIKAIEKHGILLVFPQGNRPLPLSLWSVLHPGQAMRWEWDQNGDQKVATMWYLMKRLSDSGRVVYSKWYQGRATFFSRRLFTAALCLMQNHPFAPVTATARRILDELESDSPLSSRDIKKLTNLQGRDNGPLYDRSMKELFQRLLIVGFGEVDDGAFPSLAVGATALLYEDLWLEAQQASPQQAQACINKYMPEGTPFRRYFEKVLLSSRV